MKSLLLFVCSMIVALAVMEAATRLIAPQQLVRDYAAFDPDLGPVLRPHADYHDLYGNDYWVRTNGQGMRMDEEVDFSASRKRVPVYGDSFTFGWGVDYPHSYFAQIKTFVEAGDAAVQMLNLGVGGYSTGHVSKLVDRQRNHLKPRALIYFFNSNDIIDNSITDPDYRVTEYDFTSDGAVKLTDVRPYGRVKRFLLMNTPYAWLNSHSHLFVLAKDVLKQGLHWKKHVEEGSREAAAFSAASAQAPSFTVTDAQARQADDDSDKLTRLSSAHVRELARRAGDVPILAVWIPAWEDMFAPDADKPRQRLFRKMRRALSELDRELPGFEFLDTTRLIKRDQEFAAKAEQMHFSDGHFNADGNRWFADLVAAPVADFLSRHP